MAVVRVRKEYDTVCGDIVSFFKGGGYIVDLLGNKTKFFCNGSWLPPVGTTVRLYGSFVFDRIFSGDTISVHHYVSVQKAEMNKKLEAMRKCSDITKNVLRPDEIDYVVCDGGGHVISGAKVKPKRGIKL